MNKAEYGLGGGGWTELSRPLLPDLHVFYSSARKLPKSHYLGTFVETALCKADMIINSLAIADWTGSPALLPSQEVMNGAEIFNPLILVWLWASLHSEAI